MGYRSRIDARTEEMANAADQILAREAAQMEDTKRVNADRDIARALAPQKWNELRSEFTKECEKVSRMSHRLVFDCEDASDGMFRVRRIVNGVSLPMVSFRFEPSVPAIFYESELLGSDVITFTVSAEALFYKVRN